MAGKHSKKKKPDVVRAQPERTEVMWDWLDLLLIAITLVLAFFASGNVIRSALVQLLPGSGLAILRLVLVLVFYVIEILVVVYIAHRHDHRFVTLYRLRARPDPLETPMRWLSNVALSTALILGLLALTRGFGMLWTYLTQRFEWAPTSTGDLLTMFGTSNVSMVLAVISVVVLAPFIEEIIFRGVFLSTLRTMMARVPAVIATSIIFALYHASAWAFVPHVFLGLALGMLAVTRKTLWPAIILHALYNATLMAAAFYLSQ
jgi:membrane protease YdiL (CAAX protease family)